MKTLIRALLLFSLSFMLQAGESTIPLDKGVILPSDDLVYKDNILTSREAGDLSQLQNIDLSTLQPASNYIWSEDSDVINDQSELQLQESETLNFQGSINSNKGLYRFNAILENSSDIYTIHLDETLHTLLLRKNLLRKLGYKIPATKYFKKLNVRFSSIEERDHFVREYIPTDAVGAGTRWVKSTNDLVLEIQDVAVTKPSEADFYNPAMGLPQVTINSRTLRALILPYALLDLAESVEQFGWIVGKIDNHGVVLPHFTDNEFATTLEDAQWILRKLNKLTREDIEEVVKNAFFPDGVSAVLVEKIISRRNSLNRLFSENVEPLPFNPKISFGDSLKKGKIVQKDFPGYASRFSYGDAETPFEQLRYYLYSKLQSGAIDGLVARFNSKLKGYDLNQTRVEFFQKQFQDGLQHFIETGELRPIGIDTWKSPLANANLIFSRDIVLGNYLGTDNLVQLADTFGASLELGLHVGVEGFKNGVAGSVQASVSVVRTFTHVKPVKSLKASLHEDYRNMFVNLLKNSLRDRYFSLAELRDSTDSKDEKTKKIQSLLTEINRYLNTGESLIMTDRLMPTAQVSLNFNSGLIGVGVGVGANVAVLKRIHILKKNASTLQIYDDYGYVKEINMNFSLQDYISVLRLTAKRDSGKYKMKSYMINLSSDLDKNPNFFINSIGVYNVLKYKDFETLDNNVTPVKLEADFKDKSKNFLLLLWKLKSIKGKTYYNLEAKDGINGKYFSYQKDFLRGMNVEAFTKQLVNYYLANETNVKGKFSLNVEDINPGDSFFGHSYTQTIRFESEVGASGKFEKKYLTLSDEKQGWSSSAKKLRKMMKKVNDKFQSQLFDPDQIDFAKLRLFKVGYHINLYDRGIEKLNSLTREDIVAIENRYKNERGCDVEDTNYDTPACGDLGTLKWDLRKCSKSKSEEDTAVCNVELMDDMFSSLEFKDFKRLVGEENFYVYATINGYRQKSEILNDTIYSNTLGRIGSSKWNGPLDVVRSLLGLSDGEFSGAWLRESL